MFFQKLKFALIFFSIENIFRAHFKLSIHSSTRNFLLKLVNFSLILIVMAAELVQLQPGTKVEQWTVDKKLGEGGFGAVYKVSDSTGKYALKAEDASSNCPVCFLHFLPSNNCIYLASEDGGLRIIKLGEGPWPPLLQD